ELPLPILRQPPGEQEPGIVLSVSRWVGRRGAPSERDGLAQLVPCSGQKQTSPPGPFRKVGIAGQEKSRKQVLPSAAVLVLSAKEQAQLGIPEPDIVIQRIGVQDGLPGTPRFFEPPLAQQFDWQDTLGVREFRVKSDRAFLHPDLS